jgi:hypothetical protein
LRTRRLPPTFTTKSLEERTYRRGFATTGFDPKPSSAGVRAIAAFRCNPLRLCRSGSESVATHSRPPSTAHAPRISKPGFRRDRVNLTRRSAQRPFAIHGQSSRPSSKGTVSKSETCWHCSVADDMIDCGHIALQGAADDRPGKEILRIRRSVVRQCCEDIRQAGSGAVAPISRLAGSRGMLVR